MRKKRRSLCVMAMLATCWLTGCTDLFGRFCVFLCTNSTSVQRNYNDERDKCRELSELKTEAMNSPGANADSQPSSAADKAQKVQMVSAFSDCMNNHAWGVPGPAPAAPAAATASSSGGPATPAAAPASVLEAQRKRAADCAFARQNADFSIIAKKRAEACDLECKQQMQLAPGAPKPAACQ